MSLKIMPLTKELANKVAELESQLIAKTSAEAVEATIESDIRFYFVLLDENDVCGFFECSVIAPESELYEIAIDKKFQGKGYSKVLIDYYLKFAKEKNCDTIFLEVNNINMKAISLYKKYGFIEYGQRKNYYGENQHAILMKLKI